MQMPVASHIVKPAGHFPLSPTRGIIGVHAAVAPARNASADANRGSWARLRQRDSLITHKVNRDGRAWVQKGA